MAMHTKKHILALYTFVLFLDYNFALISAYRPREVRPPSPVRELIKSAPPPPAQGLTKSTPIKSSPPSLTESTPQTQERAFTRSNSKVKASNPKAIRARITRYKKIQADAYRPTSPGNSPGMGHDVPPRG